MSNTPYSSSIAGQICRELSRGRTLRDVCGDAQMPSADTVMAWVHEDCEGFSARYRQARDIGYQLMADEMLEIADDGGSDFRKRKDNAEPTVDHEHISRSRLRVETRRWLLDKALPRLCGQGAGAPDPIRELLKAIDGQTRGLGHAD